MSFEECLQLAIKESPTVNLNPELEIAKNKTNETNYDISKYTKAQAICNMVIPRI